MTFFSTNDDFFGGNGREQDPLSSLPVAAQHSLKFFANSGVSARTGDSFDVLGIAWLYRWSDSP